MLYILIYQLLETPFPEIKVHNKLVLPKKYGP